MPKRDSSGKFIKEKEEEELKLVFNLPPLSRIIFWLILLIVLTPWIVIFFLFKIWKEIMKKFEHLFHQRRRWWDNQKEWFILLTRMKSSFK